LKKLPIVALLLIAAMTFFALTCNAQTHPTHASPPGEMVTASAAISPQQASAQDENVQIKIVERLPSGEYVLSINGVEQRTITAEHARTIGERLDELDRLRRAQPLYEQEIGQLKTALDLSKRDTQLANAQ